MARKSTTKSVDEAATVESTVAVNETDNDINVKVKTTSKKVEPLENDDEIDVISLVPNVSYKDSKTNDFYEWDEVGHVEPMTYETLKNMWRNHKGYFRNMKLKPMDERVISKFGLKSVFEKYEFLRE